MNLLSGARSAPVKEKNSKVPGGQSAAGAPPHQPTAAKSRTQRRAKVRKQPEGTTPPATVKQPQPLLDQDLAAGGVVGWVAGAGAKVRGHLHRQAFGKKEKPPARETRNFPLFCYRNLVFLPVFSISPWPFFPNRLSS